MALPGQSDVWYRSRRRAQGRPEGEVAVGWLRAGLSASRLGMILGVVVGRRPAVFVRSLSMEEGRRLQRITRTVKDPVKLRRAIVVIMSARGLSVPSVPSLIQVSVDYVRSVIHAFNERDLEALDPKWGGGRPRTISSQVREDICLIARTSSADWGIAAFSPGACPSWPSTWSNKPSSRLTAGTSPAEDQLRPGLTHPHLDRLSDGGGLTPRSHSRSSSRAATSR
jgi:hypothetical protein